MNIQPILSYKQLRKINIDTTHSDMKLGTGAFSIVFKISPYTQFRDSAFNKILDQGSHFKSIIYDDYNESQDDMFKTTWHSIKNEDFFPIFTYNPILLYDHFNIDTKSYFYNTHACYIYKNEIHQLINGISDNPVLHLKVPVSDYNGATIINLSRIGNTFSLEISDKGNHYEIDMAESNIDLDVYDTGEMTLGYAERIPTYEYDSYTYKNSLYGNIDWFKIFKDVTYRLDNQQQYNRFENFTQNSKYVFDGITYHNRDNKMCNVNWLDTKYDNVDYKIKNLYNLDVSIYRGFHQTNGYDTPQLKTTLAEDMNEDSLNTIYPILTFDVEHKLDETNIEFYQDKYIVGGYYTDGTAYFDSTIINDINIDTIQNKISLFDIFRCQIDDIIDDEDPELVQYGNNYVKYISIINDIILYYETLGINVKNFQIKPDVQMEYTIKAEVQYTTIHDINVKPTILEGGYNSTYKLTESIQSGQSGSAFNSSIFKYNENELYSHVNDLGLDHKIMITAGGTAIRTGNILKIILSDEYTYIDPDTVEFDTFSGMMVSASSQLQYETLTANIIEYYYPYVGNSYECRISKFLTSYGYLDDQDIINFDHFSLETTDGTVILEFDHEMIGADDIYQKIIDTFPIEYLMHTTLLIMVTQTCGTKYYLQRFNKNTLQPRIVSKTEISNTNTIVESDNDMTVNLSNDHSDVMISFDQQRALGTTSNFILLTYTNVAHPFQQDILNWSKQLHPYFYIQNDITPRTNIEKQFVKFSDRYIDTDEILFRSPIDKTQLRYRPDRTSSQQTDQIECFTELELKQNPDNTWYVK